jgi:hypothetical protein
VEVSLRGKGCREGRAQVSAKEGFILGEGAYGATPESDMDKPGSWCFIPILFAGDGLKRVNVSGNLTFVDIEDITGPNAKLLDYF